MMASTSNSRAMPPPPNPHLSWPHLSHNHSILLEKARLGVGRSTPDSDALASSDEETEHHSNQAVHGPSAVNTSAASASISTSAPTTRPGRRTSWLNEVPPSLARKPSLTTTASSSSAIPITAADQSAWPPSPNSAFSGPSLGWNATASTNAGNSPFSWGTSIWDNMPLRKEPPPRLSEVLQSPTSPKAPSSAGTTTATGGSGMSGTAEDALPLTQTVSAENLPFSIPLQPTPKAYRSQSYSVGQLDPEVTLQPPGANKLPSGPLGSNSAVGRGRTASYGVQRRSSRTSMLGELGHDLATLGRVREDEDDITSEDHDKGYNWTVPAATAASQARQIEHLARENAMLRRAAASGQLDNTARFRDRVMSSASASGPYLNLHHLAVPEESDPAIEDNDEIGAMGGYRGAVGSAGPRRFSEHSTASNGHPHLNTTDQLQTLAALESMRMPHWQTSLDFNRVPELPGSRRHSFVDMPMRSASLGLGTGAGGLGIDGLSSSWNRSEDGIGYDLGVNDALAGLPAVHHHYNSYAPRLPQSPQSLQKLFVVTFKCSRADVYYIEEDNGLQPKEGDLVIVEADRGTDLGTVADANVSWSRARELKERYAEEHYNWLMMFSQKGQTLNGPPINPNGHSHGHGPGSDGNTELKPKLIKRLAQPGEISTLREKEGSEAKAKRICQQKVMDHGLNMEILDAEFQVDWKKLTFYYFADTYINFNSLVTDLFKIYKTRIWMSAINPASFVSPTTSIQLQTAGMGYMPDKRRPAQPAYGAGLRDMVSPSGLVRNPYADVPFNAFLSNSIRQPEMLFNSPHPHPHAHAHGAGLAPQPDPFSAFPSTSPGAGAGLGAAYSMPDSASPLAMGLNPASTTDLSVAAARRTHPAHGDWIGNFQGLSLGM